MRKLALCLTVSVLVVACATSPTGRHQLKLVSEPELNEMGIASFQQIKQEVPATKNNAQASYVRCVANAITREIPSMAWNVSVPSSWEVVTFQSDELNAFALPGGKIGVYTGLLKVATTQDELAAVIGHEVSHVLAGHSAERVSNQMVAQVSVGIAQARGGSGQLVNAVSQAFFLLPFSRTHETEADLLGMDLMAKAGFDPRASITLWQKMAQQQGAGNRSEMLSTHPSSSTRIKNLSERLSRTLPMYQQAKSRGRTPRCS